MDTIKAVRGNTRPVYRGQDYTGRYVGLWNVLGPITCDRVGVTKNYKTRWLCQCKCGAEPEWVIKENIVAGRSLGCLRCSGSRMSGSGNGNWTGFGDISGSFFSRVVTGAKARGIHVLVSIEDLDALWKAVGGVCALTGTPIRLDADASLDRIDSEKPYQLGNLQWVHKDVNLAKNALPQARFIEICKQVSEYLK